MDVDKILDELSDEEREYFEKKTASEYFKYIYNTPEFQRIYNSIDSSIDVSDDEWKYLLTKLFLVTAKSYAEEDKLSLGDKLFRAVCRIRMFFCRKDSGVYNELYKLLEYLNCIKLSRTVDKNLFTGYTLCEILKHKDVLNLLLQHHFEACEFRDSRDTLREIINKNSDVGTIDGSERSAINVMHRSFEREKKLILEYDDVIRKNDL